MTIITDGEARALESLDELGERTWGPMLAELMAIPSVTGSPAEADAQRWVAGQCERIGLDVDLWSCDLDELRAVRSESSGSARPVTSHCPQAR